MIVILKVGGLSAAADCIRQAIRADGLPWKLTHVSSLNQAKLALERQRVDLLLLHHQVADGDAISANLPVPSGVLRVMSVEAGQEAVAAAALDAGFDDYVIENPHDGYAAVMLAQIRSALRHRANARTLVEQHALLEAISRAQSRFIDSSDNRVAYQALLTDVLRLTNSPIGFVGEVFYDQPGVPHLQVHALSDVSWDETSRKRYADADGPGMRFDRLDTLFGAALQTGEPVISSSPHGDARSGGLPKGHPALRSFMALPVGVPGQLQALIGLANRPGGYHASMVTALQPLLDTVAQLVVARRAQRERADLLNHLQTTLESMDQGLLVIDARGRCVLFNRCFLTFMEIDEAFMTARPLARDMLAMMVARGDYGPDFAWVQEDAVRDWLRAGTPTAQTPIETYRRVNRHGRTIETHNWRLPTGEVVRKFTDVTEEVQQRQALVNARERLATTIDGTQAGTWEWNIQTDSVTINNRFAALVGYRREEIPSDVQALYELLLHPADRDRLVRANERHLSGEIDHYECQFRFRHKEGRWIWVLERGRVNQRSAEGQPMLMSGITIDISESKAAEDALRDTTQQLRERTADLERTLQAMSQGMMVVSADGRIRLFNRQLCGILNMPEVFFAASPTLTELVQRQTLRGDFGSNFSLVEPGARNYVQSATEQSNDPAPRRYVRRTSSGRYLEVKSDPLPDGGFIRTFTDVTPFVEAADAARDRGEEVRLLNETLEERVAERTAQLERSMHDIEALSYSIAHDLRGPLRAVNGFAALIAADEADRLSPEGRELFGRITEASRRMGVMITDLLQLFKVVRAELTTETVDMTELAQDAVRALAAAYPETQVDIDPTPPASGDAALLRILMGNLMDNALKYSARTAQPKVQVGWDAGQKAWFVRDNGVGFDMAQAGKLFGMFQRLHTPADFDGTGLGLAVASRVAERHGGRIWAQSEPGQGACFWFQLGDAVSEAP